MSDIVKFGADATQYFEVVDRMRTSLAGLGGSVGRAFNGGAGGEEFGTGFLKGERRVSGQAKFLVSSMLEARDGISAAEAAMQAFVLSTRVGLGATVIGVGLFEAFKILHGAIVETTAAAAAFHKVADIPDTIASALSPGDIGKVFDQAEAKFTEFEKKASSTANIVARELTTPGLEKLVNPVTLETTSSGRDPFAGIDNEDITEQTRVTQLAKFRGEAELKVAQAKADVVTQGTLDAQLAKIALEAEQKRAAIKQNPDAGSSTRIKAINIEEDAEKRLATVKQGKLDADRAFEGQSSAIKVAAAEASVGAGSEEAQRINLEAQLAISEELAAAAANKLALDLQDKNAQQALTKSLGEQRSAQAALDKFNDERAFQHDQALDTAKGGVDVAALKASGDKLGAGILAERLRVEQQITSELRNQNGDLADQHEKAGEINILSQGVDEIIRKQNQTPAQRAAEQAAQFQRDTVTSATNDRVERFLAAQDALANGASALDLGALPTLTPDEQKIADGLQSLRDKQEAGGDNGIQSLADADFSSLKSLADADFSGLEALSGLQITVQ